MFINNFDPVAFTILSLEIRWYSLAYIFGILIGWYLSKKFFIDNLPSEYIAIESHANFVLVKTPNSEEVLRKMKENKILIRDRSSFTNLDDCVRITIGSKKQIIRVLDVLSN